MNDKTQARVEAELDKLSLPELNALRLEFAAYERLHRRLEDLTMEELRAMVRAVRGEEG